MANTYGRNAKKGRLRTSPPCPLNGPYLTHFLPMASVRLRGVITATLAAATRRRYTWMLCNEALFTTRPLRTVSTI